MMFPKSTKDQDRFYLEYGIAKIVYAESLNSFQTRFYLVVNNFFVRFSDETFSLVCLFSLSMVHNC